MAGSRLVHQTSEKSDCATDKKVVKADAYVVACDVPGIKRLLPSQWRESKVAGSRTIKAVAASFWLR
ncbi:hypothetical protein OIU78_029479 [Salix suchowensis]|nr:hypothetical protein OIU78_029479 [Salix suchowensis]